MREKDMDNSNIDYMICDLCGKKLHPLDANFGRLKGKLITAHIECWNKEVDSIINQMKGEECN